MARVQKAYRRFAGRQARSEKGDFGDRKKDRKARRRREAAQLINTYSAPNELCYHQVVDQIIHEVVPEIPYTKNKRKWTQDAIGYLKTHTLRPEAPLWKFISEIVARLAI